MLLNCNWAVTILISIIMVILCIHVQGASVTIGIDKRIVYILMALTNDSFTFNSLISENVKHWFINLLNVKESLFN